MNASLRIAVADDEPDMRDYFKKCLPRLGHQVVAVAQNGQELVEKCRETRPDLVITDIKMPDMDGIDAAQQICRDRPVPVILVSAYHNAELIACADADHILGYLVKPIKQADLEPVIALAMRRFEQFKVLRQEAADLLQRDQVARTHLDHAARIQRQLLPAGPPEVPSFSFALMYHPLDQVSGDYYDFAFVSVMANTAFHAYALGIESPAAVLCTLNSRLANLMEANQFITMFYGVVERSTRRLVYALAGHPRPLWYRRATGNVEALDAAGPMIGIGPEAVFEERWVALDPGDLVLIYTDGVTECRNEQQEQFGQRRLESFLAAHGDSGAGVVVPRLDRELARFRGLEPFHDDVTCIALSVEV
jgi:two-component system, response regulator PdtaR